jgi:3-dehydroquinate dehydratase-2
MFSEIVDIWLQICDNSKQFSAISNFYLCNLTNIEQTVVMNKTVVDPTITTGILVLNGPNLNLLGSRERGIYGSTTLAEINRNLTKIAMQHDVSLDLVQHNSEHEIIETIHSAVNKHINCIIINAGAYTHTSIAIRDALLAVDIPFIELHISNVYSRESFRQHSYLSDVARGVICGFGVYSYELALRAAINMVALRDGSCAASSGRTGVFSDLTTTKEYEI